MWCCVVAVSPPCSHLTSGISHPFERRGICAAVKLNPVGLGMFYLGVSRHLCLGFALDHGKYKLLGISSNWKRQRGFRVSEAGGLLSSVMLVGH